MKKLYNKYRHQRYEEQEYAMPVIARYGTGGGNMPIVLEALPFDTTQVTSPRNWSHPKPDDPCHPLAATAHIPAVAIGNGQTNNIAMSETANNLDCMHDQQAVLEYKGGDAVNSVVRRITPLE